MIKGDPICIPLAELMKLSKNFITTRRNKYKFVDHHSHPHNDLILLAG